MTDENYEIIIKKVALGMKIDNSERDIFLGNERMRFFSHIPYYLKVGRPLEYAVRNLALLIGDIRADWFPGSGYTVETLMDRFFPLMLYPNVPLKQVEPLFYGPMAGMLSSWIYTLEDDMRNNEPNIGKEGVNLQALKDSYLKMAADHDSELYKFYPLDIWDLRGKWF